MLHPNLSWPLESLHKTSTSKHPMLNTRETEERTGIALWQNSVISMFVGNLQHLNMGQNMGLCNSQQFICVGNIHSSICPLAFEPNKALYFLLFYILTLGKWCVQLPPPVQTHDCWTYQLGPLISVISLAAGNKGLICADGLQPTRPLGPFTFADKFVSWLIGRINHAAPARHSTVCRCIKTCYLCRGQRGVQ